MTDKNPLILHFLLHGYWWPGNTGSQDINSYDIDPVILEYTTCQIYRIDGVVPQQSEVTLVFYFFGMITAILRDLYKNT